MSEKKQPDSISGHSSLEETTQNKLSQGELVALLQKTLQQLDGIVKKLNTESLDNLPSQSTVETLVKSTEAIALWVDTSSPISTKKVHQPSASVDTPKPTKAKEVLGRKLSKGAIAGIVAVGIVAILSTALFLLPRSLPNIVQSPQEVPQIVETPSESSELPQLVEIPPPPVPELTPEQSLIAAIGQEVTDLTNQYPEGLIGTIEANFSTSRLIVTMGEQWYQLTSKNQENLANTILKRAQRLDFRKLEIIDSQKTLIARNPVVGDEIIILKRSP